MDVALAVYKDKK